MTPQRRLRASFSGYYGMGNFGDDLFGMICAAATRRYWYGDAQLVGPAIPGVPARYTMPDWFPPRLYGSSSRMGQASRLYSFVRAVHTSDVLVLGGGSVINSRVSFRRRLMMSAEQSGLVALAALGVSIGPFETDAATSAAAAFLHRFAYISVRDRRSYELALAMGLRDRVHHGRDLAGLLPLLAGTDSTKRGASLGQPAPLGIALCNYHAPPDYHAPDKRVLVHALADAVAAESRQRSIPVELFCLNEHAEHGDRVLAHDLHRLLEERGVAAIVRGYSSQSPQQMAEHIGRCGAFISARLHGALVAYMYDVPFVIVDYHPKCRDFADDIGLPESQRLTAERQSPTVIRTTIAEMLDRRACPRISSQAYAQRALDIFRCSPWWRGG